MKPQTSPTTPNREADVAVERLRSFRVISNRVLQRVIAYLPVLLALLLLADWLIGSRAFTGDYFRLTSVLAVAVELLITGNLISRLPEAVESIWTRNLILYPTDPGQTQTEFV